MSAKMKILKLPEVIFFEEKVGTNGIHCLDYRNSHNIKYIREDVAKKINLAPDMPTPKYQTIQQLCPKCNGEGRILSDPGEPVSTTKICPVCSGAMTVFSTIYF